MCISITPYVHCTGSAQASRVVCISITPYVHCTGSAQASRVVCISITPYVHCTGSAQAHSCSVYKYHPCMYIVQVLTTEQHKQALAAEYNFDHPDAFDFDLVVETLTRLKEGKNVEVPIYNFSTHGREKEKVLYTSICIYI